MTNARSTDRTELRHFRSCHDRGKGRIVDILKDYSIYHWIFQNLEDFRAKLWFAIGLTWFCSD